MGISISKNTVDSLIQNTQTIISNYENICTVKGDTSQATFDARGCKFGPGTVINIGATQNVNQTCISSVTTRNNMTNEVRQSMQQSAQAITQSFAFPSLSDSESFIRQSVELGENIVSNYYSICITEASSAQAKFTCENSTFNGAVINLESYQNLSQQCNQKFANNNDLTTKLASNLSQSDVAQNQSIFGTFAAIFIILILIFAYAGISLAENPLVEWGIVILVAISVISSIVYSISAEKYGNYPYNKK